jgi:hypothetical protein
MEQQCQSNNPLHKKAVEMAKAHGHENMELLLQAMNPKKLSPADVALCKDFIVRTMKRRIA